MTVLYFDTEVHMEIIDTHAHIFPEKIADKAQKSIGKFYNIDMQATGATSDALIESGKKIGVSKYLVHATATVAGQVQNINNFVLAETQKHPEFVGFATLHPDLSLEEIEKEVERVEKAGLKGIKLHPDMQKFDIDEEKALKMYDVCENRLPILFHTGDARYEFSAPSKLLRIAKKYPKLLCIGAHFGGYSRWEEAINFKNVDNVFFDTSSTLFKLPAFRAKELINSLGEDRFMFGADFPMWDHEGELKRFYAMELTDKQNQKVLSENAKNILKIF